MPKFVAPVSCCIDKGFGFEVWARNQLLSRPKPIAFRLEPESSGITKRAPIFHFGQLQIRQHQIDAHWAWRRKILSPAGLAFAQTAPEIPAVYQLILQRSLRNTFLPPRVHSIHGREYVLTFVKNFMASVTPSLTALPES
ncbi:MAG: hypothetical protein WBA92_05470, partial [Pseudorhodobacter sp.]